MLNKSSLVNQPHKKVSLQNKIKNVSEKKSKKEIQSKKSLFSPKKSEILSFQSKPKRNYAKNWSSLKQKDDMEKKRRSLVSKTLSMRKQWRRQRWSSRISTKRKRRKRNLRERNWLNLWPMKLCIIIDWRIVTGKRMIVTSQELLFWRVWRRFLLRLKGQVYWHRRISISSTRKNQSSKQKVKNPSPAW